MECNNSMLVVQLVNVPERAIAIYSVAELGPHCFLREWLATTGLQIVSLQHLVT